MGVNVGVGTGVGLAANVDVDTWTGAVVAATIGATGAGAGAGEAHAASNAVNPVRTIHFAKENSAFILPPSSFFSSSPVPIGRPGLRKVIQQRAAELRVGLIVGKLPFAWIG